MSHGNQSYLRFSLEESVWFQRGQEVEELISISLDPNITINESDQYVTIKGSLELYGEYKRDEYDFDEEDELFSNPKFIQTVDVREEGGCFFTHHFPVEITIPKNRVRDIETIDVSVETFDYAFPERSCLRLSADLMITGLYGEQQHEFFIEGERDDDFIDEAEDEYIEEEDTELESRIEELESGLETEVDEENSQEYTEISIDDYLSNRSSSFSIPDYEENREEEVYEPFEVEARKEAKADEVLKSLTEELDHEEIQQGVPFQPFQEEEEPVSETNDYTSLESEEVREEENEEPALEKDSPITTIPDIFFLAKRNEHDNEQNGSEGGVPQDTMPQTDTQPESVNEIEPVDEQEESSEEAAPPAKGKKKKWKKHQSLSITEFLARKEETSESHTKLRVCIVQKGDTIDTLSDRYEVSVNSLQRVNNLEINQDVYEGQVLYIPVVQNQK